MKKFFAKILCAGAFLALLAPVAKADSISGSVSIAGSDTFNSTGITFNPTTGIVLQSTITGVTPGQIASLTSFAYASAAGTTLFTTTANGTTLSFIISSLTMVDLSTPNFLNLAGNGTFTETGRTNTTGNFTLTSSTTGLTSFQLVGNAAATPEPNSLMLLGTGLISTAGMLVRRRRAANVA